MMASQRARLAVRAASASWFVPLLWGSLAAQDGPPLRLSASQAWEAGRVAGYADPGDLTFISQLTLDRSGRLFALEPSRPGLLVFDASGQLDTLIGQRGSGPGDFQFPANMGWIGDSLWLMDQGLHRLTVFSPNLRMVRTISYAEKISKLHEAPAAATNLFTDGSVVLIAQHSSTATPEKDDQRLPIFRMAPDGSRLDTIAWRTAVHATLRVEHRGTTIFTAQPWDDSDIVEYSGDGRGMVVVRRAAVRDPLAGRIEITWLAPSGATTLRRTYAYDPLPLDDAEFSKVLAAATLRAARSLRATGRESQVELDVRRALFRPRYLPPVSRAALAIDGTLWLRRETHVGLPSEWVAIGPDGHIKGAVALPSTTRLLQSIGTHIWVVELDEDEVPHLAMYQLSRKAR